MQSAQEQLERELLQRERERRDALVADDVERFASLLADDLVHVHTTGIVHGKPELLQHTGGFLRFREILRGPLLIRSLGTDAGVMTGPMTNIVQRRDREDRVTVEAHVTQVWVRRDGDWRITSFHATRVADQGA